MKSHDNSSSWMCHSSIASISIIFIVLSRILTTTSWMIVSYWFPLHADYAYIRMVNGNLYTNDALLLRERCSSLCAGWDGYWALKAVQASQRLVSQSESFGEKINPPYFLHGKQRDFKINWASWTQEQFDTFEYLTYDDIVLFIAFSRTPFFARQFDIASRLKVKLGQKLKVEMNTTWILWRFDI